MNFPQDAGLSCVRHFLRPSLGDELEALTVDSLDAKSHVVGRLRCHYCGDVDDWSVAKAPDIDCGIAGCGCNGSVLPVYIGAPPKSRESAAWTTCQCPKCRHNIHSIVIGIGYAFDHVPKVGLLDAERAVSVAFGLHCRACGHEFIGWSLNLAEPPCIRGNEPWLDRIQGLERRRRIWQHGESE